MKKIVLATVLVLSMLFTVGFCFGSGDPNPPKGIAPIDYTNIYK